MATTSPDASFDDLMLRLRAGDEDAATQVFERFAGRLVALARTRLNSQIRAKVDPEDVMQSVFKSFFLRYSDGQFSLESWDSLWGMLVVLTLRRCGRRVEHFRAACRDVQREVAAPIAGTDSGADWQAMAREPTPDEAAALADTVEQIMRGLDERDRRVFMLRLQGFTVPEISAQVGRTERTVQRGLERVRKLLEQME